MIVGSQGGGFDPTKLPLAGGTLTGDLVLAAGVQISSAELDGAGLAAIRLKSLNMTLDSSDGTAIHTAFIDDTGTTFLQIDADEGSINFPLPSIARGAPGLLGGAIYFPDGTFAKTQHIKALGNRLAITARSGITYDPGSGQHEFTGKVATSGGFTPILTTDHVRLFTVGGAKAGEDEVVTVSDDNQSAFVYYTIRPNALEIAETDNGGEANKGRVVQDFNVASDSRKVRWHGKYFDGATKDLDAEMRQVVSDVPFAQAAFNTLLLTANPLDTETVTIDAKVYTFQTVLTDVDGNVFIGASLVSTIDNLRDAINLGAGAGVDYAASMTLHPTANAKDVGFAGGELDVIANTAGTGGNSIATTETVTGGSWLAGATMSGGQVAAAALDGYIEVAFDDNGAGPVESTRFWKNGALTIAGDLDHNGSNVGFYGTAPAAQSASYTRDATIIEDRTLLASASATTTNNNNVLAALIADLQAVGLLA